MSETDTKTEAVEAAPDQIERLCPKCGEGNLPPRYRVHDDCLATPTATRRRERVRAAGHAYVKSNQRNKFDRILATVSDVQLDVWEDREADAMVEGAVDEPFQPRSKAGRAAIAMAVASRVFETVDDPGVAKKSKAGANAA